MRMRRMKKEMCRVESANMPVKMGERDEMVAVKSGTHYTRMQIMHYQKYTMFWERERERAREKEKQSGTFLSFRYVSVQTDTNCISQITHLPFINISALTGLYVRAWVLVCVCAVRTSGILSGNRWIDGRKEEMWPVFNDVCNMNICTQRFLQVFQFNKNNREEKKKSHMYTEQKRNTYEINYTVRTSLNANTITITITISEQEALAIY